MKHRTFAKGNPLSRLNPSFLINENNRPCIGLKSDHKGHICAGDKPTNGLTEIPEEGENVRYDYL